MGARKIYNPGRGLKNESCRGSRVKLMDVPLLGFLMLQTFRISGSRGFGV